ncbi:lanthionine synthetase C family protein [Streptomyces sp. V1I1]|uniref:lanthionine synthetase C family protein n=1 Tax=Streptomyces sp. V1I1 TaxID=3042272 RepID=UPI0027880D2E|nr:lanthionine synthetase C family protein [Streptomyces sp. V1I1]MDQ0943458.1 hypothetical protein [Streptomyces sp. V1I1]
MTRLQDRCDTARETVHTVAELLSDPGRVARTSGRAFADVPSALMLPGWQPASVLLGHAGISMLHTRCARDDARWSPVAHAHLAAAVAAAPQTGPAAAGNLILPALLRAADTGGYARLLARSAALHADFTEHRLARLRQRRNERPGLSYLDYDVIAGLAGQGRALMLAADHGDEQCARVLTDVLGFLVALTHPLDVNGSEVPGWWCAPEGYVVPRDREAFPGGDFNVGAAHGICGPLALLSLAHLAGYRVPGTLDAVRRITDWLREWARVDDRGVSWPGRVAFDEETSTARPAGSAAQASARPGWCYGTSGIAWTLYLAGQVLADREASSLAVTAMKGILRRPLDELTGEDPGFCHGLAGVLQAVVRLAVETSDPELWQGADRAADALVSALRPDSAFGYRQVVRSGAELTRLDSPGVIDGAAGVALVLTSYADARRGRLLGKDAWDAVFLMS